MNRNDKIGHKIKIIEWHKATFPLATLESQLLKLDEELQEYHNALFKDKEEAKKELVDVWIVTCVLENRFKSHIGRIVMNDIMGNQYPFLFKNIEELYQAITDKMQINMNRVWVYENGVYRHKEE